MSQPTNESDSDEKVLPPEELNPLLNPLLAEHMGRWAEVYFTNPPEKRDQAIAELVRELESNPRLEISPDQSGSGQPDSDPLRSPQFGSDHLRDPFVDENGAQKRPEASARDTALYGIGPVLTCSSCGEKNWREQRFCGMCGAPLGPAPEAATNLDTEALPIARASWTEPGLSPRDHSTEHVSEPAVQPTPVVEEDIEYEGADSAWSRPAALPAFGVEAEPEPLRYRYKAYIGVVLAIVLGALIYVGWRHTSGAPGASSLQSAPVLSASRPADQAAQAPAARPPVSAQPSARKNAKNVPASKPPAPLPTRQPEVRFQTQDRTGTRKEQPVASLAAGSQPSATGQSGGTTELAMAEKYLKGGRGTTPNSSEAARWLWKAVSKKNLAAMVELSDLYLRGDGVPKSCDQAHLLLDAAARKGETAAAVRLRNLPSFGCQ